MTSPHHNEEQLEQFLHQRITNISTAAVEDIVAFVRQATRTAQEGQKPHEPVIESISGTTKTKCRPCGREFGTLSEQQQHLEWQRSLASRTAVIEARIDELEPLAKLTESYDGKRQLLALLVEGVHTRLTKLRAHLSTEATK